MLSTALLSWRCVEVFASLAVLILVPIGLCLMIRPDDIEED